MLAFPRISDATQLTNIAEDVTQTHAGAEVLDTMLVRAAPINLRPMVRKRRIAIGLYLVAACLILLPTMLWAWSNASRVLQLPERQELTATFLWTDFLMTADLAMLLIVELAAIAGSLAILTRTFAYRAGYETLERGFVWWYLVRPFTGALLGLIFYLAVDAGYFSHVAKLEPSSLALAAMIGGLAGLFTDEVLTRLRSVLGLLATHEVAQDQPDGKQAK